MLLNNEKLKILIINRAFFPKDQTQRDFAGKTDKAHPDHG